MITDITELQQLQEFANEFSRDLAVGDVVYLSGDLGTGKTTFTQFLLRQLGYSKRVKSPTYAIYECYKLPLANIYHIDLYRLSNAEELYYLGLDEIFNGENIVLIEWPEKGEGVLPAASKTLEFELSRINNRTIKSHIT